jgi:hypothetical protein
MIYNLLREVKSAKREWVEGWLLVRAKLPDGVLKVKVHGLEGPKVPTLRAASYPWFDGYLLDGGLRIFIGWNINR